MKSKEEILRTHLGSIWSHQDFDALGKYVYAAMDEYASQQAPPTTKELIEDCEREGDVLKKRVEELQAPAMYTREQVEKAIEFGFNQCANNGYISKYEQKQFIKSLK